MKRKVKIDVFSMRCIYDTLDSILTSLNALTLHPCCHDDGIDGGEIECVYGDMGSFGS